MRYAKIYINILLFLPVFAFAQSDSLRTKNANTGKYEWVAKPLRPIATITPGAYTNTNITVDAWGRIVAIANGTAGASNWTVSGSNIYRSSKVGINNTLLRHTLTLSGGMSVEFGTSNLHPYFADSWAYFGSLNDIVPSSGGLMIGQLSAYNARYNYNIGTSVFRSRMNVNGGLAFLTGVDSATMAERFFIGNTGAIIWKGLSGTGDALYGLDNLGYASRRELGTGLQFSSGQISVNLPAANYWTKTGSDLSYLPGNVKIGTQSTDIRQLDLSGNFSIDYNGAVAPPATAGTRFMNFGVYNALPATTDYRYDNFFSAGDLEGRGWGVYFNINANVGNAAFANLFFRTNGTTKLWVNATGVRLPYVATANRLAYVDANKEIQSTTIDPANVLTAVPTLQQVTTVSTASYLTTRQIRSDSMVVVRGTQSTFNGIQIINTTASTGIGWSLRSMNNGGLQLISSGLATALTTWKGSDLFHNGKGRVGAGTTTVTAATFAATDSLSTVAYNTVENKFDGSAAHAYFFARANSSSSANAGIIFDTKNSGGSGYVGVHKSDSSSLKMGLGGAVGTNAYYQLTPTGQTILGGGVAELGAEVTVNADLSAKHVVAGGDDPAAVATTTFGSAATAQCFGGDMAFQLVYVTGDTPDAADKITVTFDIPLPADYKPIVQIKDLGATAWDHLIYVDHTSRTNTSFEIKFRSTMAASTTFRADVHVIGAKNN